MTRSYERSANQLRPLEFQPGIAPHAMGSVLVSFGKTRVICAASIQEGVPRWMKEQKVSGGWLTAEYAMLPYSTLDRKARASSTGKQDGRGVEIQRLIGRSLRAAIDLDALGPRTLWVDCDVLQADGGTRTASISGACVAAGLAFHELLREAKITKNPLRSLVAAVSLGVVNGGVLLDLDYLEDKDASVDLNLVMTENLDLVELQASGEEAVFSESELQEMLATGKEGIRCVLEAQKKVLDELTSR
jgi:ribonuclease PH